MNDTGHRHRVGQEELRLADFGELPRREWLDLTCRDPAAFGSETAALIYRPKEHYVGWRTEAGRLVAVIGATIVTVQVEAGPPFSVVGIGSLIVHVDFRGRGLSTALSNRIWEIAAGLGPDRAMIFCERALLPLHTRRGYLPIDAQVRVDQPGGRIEMPIPAMWRPVGPSEWPSAPVDVHGLPF
ncbi:MAG: GNAT family N-acetyltransferase [Gaiellaceae bacterium]